LIVEIDVCHKPLLKASKFLLLLLQHDDEAIRGVPAECIEVERMIGSIDEVGQVAPPYTLEVR
jgi:hypothetical protein